MDHDERPHQMEYFIHHLLRIQLQVLIVHTSVNVFSLPEWVFDARQKKQITAMASVHGT